jgi:enamine deaminase RidA (YjgF/YER057c/UK114 family)
MRLIVRVEAKIEELGLVLPERSEPRPDFPTPFTRLRFRGNRIYVAGQGPRDADGTYGGPFGKVPSDVTLEQGREAARKAALSIVADLKRELGDLDRVTAWLMVSGFVNADPGYGKTTLVMNGFSDLILELFGEDVGQHARSSIGAAALPNNTPVIAAAELEFE